MNEGLISLRYARAMFHFAQEKGLEGMVYDKMKLFEENYISHPDLQKALMSPVLSAENKERLLSTAIGIEPGEAYLRGIRLLIKNRREGYMKSICLMYQKLYREAKGILRVKIITASALTDSVIDKIKAKVECQTSCQLEFTHEVDPSIIGGFILEMGSKQLDASVRKELKLLRLNLLAERYD